MPSERMSASIFSLLASFSSASRTVVRILAGIVFCLGAALVCGAERAPNIVFILADDLGYGDIGAYGQKKIRTPHLDRLASEGMRFTQHYSGNAVCAPSRCVLITGRHPGHAVVRDNREVKPEGQFSLPAEGPNLARLLKARGYRTGAFGKWGLGAPDSPGRPLNQGFDRFFGYNCQRAAHSYYPQQLWDDEQTTMLDNPPVPRTAKLPDGADPHDPASYGPYAGQVYSADVIAEQALQFVRDNRDSPFFLFWPTTVPHLALQVPEDSLAEYRGLWPDPPYPGGRGYTPHISPRAAYAAMITRMDRAIGRLLDLLDELKLADNTIVIFTSDNGPVYDRHGGTDSDFFRSAGGLRGRKGSLYEGGVRVPLIVRWPGRVAAGSVCDRVTGFEDWLPTLAEAVGGMPLSDGIDGISFLPSLLGITQLERPFLYREFPGYGGQQSVRVGDWKLIRRNLKPGRNQAGTTPTLELYDLARDPGEEDNVAETHPEVVEKLLALARDQHTPSPDFPFPALDRETAEGDRTNRTHKTQRTHRVGPGSPSGSYESSGFSKSYQTTPALSLLEGPETGTLTVLDGGRAVLTYRFADQLREGVDPRYTRACYIHPLYSLDGEPLTDDFPADHYHHRGVFWTWPHVETRGVVSQTWHPHVPPLRQKFVRWGKRGVEEGVARFTSENVWVLDGREEVAQEVVTVRVHPDDGRSRAIDVELVLEAVGGPLVLKGQSEGNKGYGGFCLRAAPRFKGAPLTTDGGRATEDVVAQAHRWADLSSGESGTTDGVAIFVPPDHPGAPLPWLARNSYTGFLNPSWPGGGTVELKPGRPVTLRYRIYIHRGDVEEGGVRQAWEAYAAETR